MVAVVQRMVLQHIKPDTILVGHALENDLKALKVSAVQPMPEQAAVLAIHSSESASQCHDASCQQYCTHGPCVLGVAGSGTVSLHPQSVCVGSGCGPTTCPLVAFDRTGTRENECVGAGLLGLTGAFLDFAMVRYCTDLYCPVLYCVCGTSLALQICHCKVLDTAMLYPHPRGPPARSKLKVLATRVRMLLSLQCAELAPSPCHCIVKMLPVLLCC